MEIKYGARKGDLGACMSDSAKETVAYKLLILWEHGTFSPSLPEKNDCLSYFMRFSLFLSLSRRDSGYTVFSFSYNQWWEDHVQQKFHNWLFFYFYFPVVQSLGLHTKAFCWSYITSDQIICSNIDSIAPLKGCHGFVNVLYASLVIRSVRGWISTHRAWVNQAW